jgi:5-(carboxyamino)imidazole ribonucleotide mutase
MSQASVSPIVGVVMGSDSDFTIMRAAIDALREFDIPCEARVLSAHRSPVETFDYAEKAAARGLKILIAGAGGAAHLPGVIAAATPLPVIGVPIPLSHLSGLDSLLSIVQMPAGVPVATVGIGSARNAGLLAVRLLGAGDQSLRDAMQRFQAELANQVRDKDTKLQAEVGVMPHSGQS